MRFLHRLPLVFLTGLFCATLAAAPSAHAADAKPGELVRVTDQTDATWLAKARAAYPLDHCVMSDDRFEGGAKEFIYRQAGKPDRLVRLCCNDCADEFASAPAKPLALIDQAAAAKAERK